MAAVGLLFALLFVAGLGGTLLLWLQIDRETDDTARMDRGDAERTARQDTREDGDGAGDGGSDDAGGDGDDAGGDGDDAGEGDWGSDTEWGVATERE